jgi:cytochrome c-type biogenesis protein CcmH/NrfG
LNRDHLLFLVIGVLVGFIAGYLMHEVMAARQPAPRFAFQGAAPAAPATPAPGAPGNPAGAPPGAAGGAAMAQIEQLRQHVERNPQDAEAVLALANLNFDVQNFSRARELYERYLALRPASPDVLTDLGVCHRESGEFQRALELFDQAQTLQPDHWQSRYNEVVVLAFDLRDLAAAQPVLEELRRLQPNNPSVTELAAEVERRRSAA